MARVETSTVAMLPAVEVEEHTPAMYRTVPAVLSARTSLQRGLPAVYHSPGWLARNGSSARFALGFVGALERVLDPSAALLDNLPAHLQPELAPADVLELVAAWLGLELDETWPIEQRRLLVRHAPELARRRGTRAGMELALQLIFPKVPLRVVDSGTVIAGDVPDKPPPREFAVYCDKAIPLTQQAEIARVIEQLKPVGVKYRLRVKQPAKPASE
jgi:phage tail-like protein